MTTPVNARDLILQQTSPRLLDIVSNSITLTSPNLVARYDANNQPTPSIIEITALLSGVLKGQVVFEVSGLQPNTNLVVSQQNTNKLLLDPNTFLIDTVTVSAKLLFEGVEYTSSEPRLVYREYPSTVVRLSRAFDNLSSDINGNNYTLPGINYLELYNGGSSKFTTGVVFGPATQTKSGLTCAVNPTTGEVTFTQAQANAWTSDYETFTLTATRNFITYSITYTISKLREGGTGVDTTPPPTPTNFTANAAITTVLIEHDIPEYTQGSGHSHTVLYGIQVNPAATVLPVFSSAEVLAEFTGSVYTLASDPATSWRLWIKWFSKDGFGSEVPAGGTNGLLVTTGQDVTKLLEALTGEITASQLYSDLGNRIDLIDDPNTGLVKVTNDLVTTYGSTTSAANSANQAAQSAVDAAGSASSASTSASTAATSATNAGNSASAAATSANNAATSADNAGNSASAAATSASTAATSATNAGNSASAAATSASNAATSADNAGNSASSAATSASTAATSATNAGNSASAAATSASNAATSADNAGNSASSAATSASTAATSATNAGNSASAAATSASSAATSADNAGNSASSASTSASTAATSATNAGNSASAAATSASSASTSASNANSAANSAATSLQNVQATIRGTSLGLPLEQWVLNGQSITNFGGSSVNTAVGTKALRLSGLPGAYPNQGTYVPIDYSKKYRIKFWAKPSVPSPSGVLYFSLRQFLDDSGSPGPINGGRSPYKPSGISAAQHQAQYGSGEVWGEYIYDWSASDWQEGIKFVRPEFLDNYSGGSGYWEIQGFTFYDVTDIDVVSAAVQTEATARASETGELFAQYSVKVDLAGNVAGYGLMSTSREADVISWSAVSTGILQAVTNTEPGFTLFNEVIDGRKLGDTGGNGSVDLSDGIDILKYDSQQSIPLAVQQYIEGPLTTILLSNKFKYSAYFTVESQATSEFGIRADRFYIAPPSYVNSTAPSTNLYKGRVWVDTTTTPPITKYYTGSVWSTIPQALLFVVQSSPTIDSSGQTIPAGVYIDTAFIKDATINTAKIAALAVTSGKIDSLAVTSAKIADLAVTNGKIANLAVDNAKISDLAVNNAKIANFAVTNGKIANLAVDYLKIADNSVTLYSSSIGGTGTLPSSAVGQLYGSTGYVWIKPGQTVVVDIVFDLQFKYDPKFDAVALNSIQLRRTPAGGGSFSEVIATSTDANFAAPLTPVNYTSTVYLLFKRIEAVPLISSFTYTNQESDDVAIQGYWRFNGNTLSQELTLMRNFGRMFARIK